MADLSPAAQTVLDAVEDHGKFSYRELAAAALRAAADQLGEELEFYNARVIDVKDLLAIAAELERTSAE